MSGFIHGESDWACNPDSLNPAPMPFVDGCEDCAVEAWERMTTGGVKVLWPVNLFHFGGISIAGEVHYFDSDHYVADGAHYVAGR